MIPRNILSLCPLGSSDVAVFQTFLLLMTMTILRILVHSVEWRISLSMGLSEIFVMIRWG